MKYIGYIEIAVGLGLGFGPTLGSVFYARLQYEGTMYMFGALNFLALLLSYYMLPEDLNEGISEESMAELER